MKVSEWIVIDEYCAARIVEGGDIKNVADRVAFVEKTPRVRMAPHSTEDWNNWECGPKGDGAVLRHVVRRSMVSISLREIGVMPSW